MNERTFKDCSALTSISIGGVTKIEEEAFSYSGLERILVMDAVHTIMANAFQSTASLQGPMYLPDGASVDSSSFTGSGISWPANVTIGPHSFYGTHPVPTPWPSSRAG